MSHPPSPTGVVAALFAGIMAIVAYFVAHASAIAAIFSVTASVVSMYCHIKSKK